MPSAVKASVLKEETGKANDVSHRESLRGLKIKTFSVSYNNYNLK